MPTINNEVSATDVHFSGDVLSVSLSDGRSIDIPMDKVAWLSWLKNANADQRSHWNLEPGGYAIFWDDLDDGVEIRHLLGIEPLA
jgi:Protein of unknown function (DUF2442)